MSVHGIQGSSGGYPDPSTNPALQKVLEDFRAMAQMDPSKTDAVKAAQAQLAADINKLVDDPTLKAYRNTLQDLAKGLSEMAAGDTSEGWADITSALSTLHEQFNFPVPPIRKD
jgi:hypothetical protein